MAAAAKFLAASLVAPLWTIAQATTTSVPPQVRIASPSPNFTPADPTPLQLYVVPASTSRIDVGFIEPSGISDLQRKTDYEKDIDVTATDRSGAIVARGRGKPSEPLVLDSQLAPRQQPYTITARYHDTDLGSASVTYLVSALTTIRAPRIGDSYIALEHAAVPPSTLLFVKKIADAQTGRDITVTTRGSQSVELRAGYSGFDKPVARVASSAPVDTLRHFFLNVPVTTSASFTCSDATGQTSQASLRPGHRLHIDLIALAAHAVFPLPGYAPSHEWVDSPLVVGFPVGPKDVQMIGPSMITHISRSAVKTCERGFRILRDVEDFRTNFSVAPESEAR